MAFSDWADALSMLWEQLDTGKGRGKVTAHHMYKKDDWPSSITKFPTALSLIQDVELDYALGGPNTDYYNGFTELHIVGSDDPKELPYVMGFYKKIRNLAAANMTLKVDGVKSADNFKLRAPGPSIQGPVKMQYGSEDLHWGLLIFWQVFEDTTGETGFVPKQ